MDFPVLKGACYALIQANDMALHQGSTQTSEMHTNPDSEYLKELPKHFRSFEDAVAYPPNQVFIGNLRPKDLENIPEPWYEHLIKDASRQGKHGEIMPLSEFYGLMKAVDVFDLVLLEDGFQKQVEEKLRAHPVVGGLKSLDKLLKGQVAQSQMEGLVSSGNAEPMYFEGKLIGCVKKAHEFDEALSHHVIFENLVSKASAAFSLALLLYKTSLCAEDIDYIIECSEEACGDMNQRGGGNFAKAIGEICGCVNATGSDTRSFCAGPAHALVEAAALVQSGIYKNVVVLAGGASAKLGLNARDHVKKGIPMLEDMLGAFAVHIGENDGVSPVIRTDIVGRHTIGSGASPQAVMTAIVANPIDQVGLKLKDIDTFSVEMQNPEITVPAGAGDVPKANYRMIAALGVMRKDFERSELDNVVKRIGMPGFAPTQGHIPSGVPFLAHCKDMMADGLLNRVMIIGKGSLFLGRLTNLFDGVSFVVEKNTGKIDEAVVSSASIKVRTRVGLTLLGSEHGEAEMLKGAEMAQTGDPSIEVVVIGNKVETNLTLIEADCVKVAHEIMDKMLLSGELNAAVTMHYNFPIGVSTIGRAVTPAFGKKTFIASTTGTSATERVSAMLKNTISAIAVAKACGNAKPTVGILNIDGARQVERALTKLNENGYAIHFTKSARADGGVVMRGNDMLQGVPDIMVMDSLTGNVMMKMMSAFTSGGSYEALGDGYGPGVGQGVDRIVGIISRASGAPVVAGSLSYVAACAKGDLIKKVSDEFTSAMQAGLGTLLEGFGQEKEDKNKTSEAVVAPPEKVVTEEIPGIEILELEDAVKVLWQKKIYAVSGMGCTGPVILVAPEDKEQALAIVKEAGYL